jgi:hypothetical protein
MGPAKAATHKNSHPFWRLPMHVFIDTTVLNSDPNRNGKAFADVSRLAREKKLQLHISEVSRREHPSKQTELCAEILRELKALKQKPLRDSLRKHFSLVLDTLPKPDDGIVAGFEEWLKSVNAIVHPIQDHHGKKVVNAYFDGKAPFKTAKCREDFPDAFIWQAVLDLVQSKGSIHLVSADKGFKKPALDVPAITLHKTLGSFLAASKLLEETPKAADLLQRISESIPRLAELLEIPLIEVLGERQRDDVLGDCETDINGAGKPENLAIDVSNADDLGDGAFWIPFSADVECSVYYYVEGVSGLDYVREQASIEYVNDHYSGVSDELPMHVEGYLIVEVDGDDMSVMVDHIETISESSQPA